MLQLVPYVKTMVCAVMALKGACSQAVHNKERCTALAECVRVAAQPSRALCAAPNCYASMWDCVGGAQQSFACVRASVRAWVLSMCARASLPHARSGVSLCRTHESARRCRRWLEGLCTVLRGTLGVL